MLAGIFTSNSGINGERMDSFSSRLYKSGFVSTAPLLSLSSGMKRTALNAKIVHWFEENESIGRAEITNNAGTGTTLTIAAGQVVLPKTVAMIETTGEYVYVTAVSGQNLTVIRGFADTTPQAADGSTTPIGLYLIGTAHEEGSAAPAPTLNVGYPVMNYSQIFRNTWANTRTASKINWHTGNKVAKNKQDCVSNHAKDIEKALMFGKKSLFMVNGVQNSTMTGLTGFIKTNVEACAGGGLKYKALIDWIGSLYEHNIEGQPNERMAFTGNAVISVIQEMALKYGQMRIEVGQNAFGVKINKIITPFGDLSLLTHPLFSQSPVWQHNILAFHPGAVELRYMDDAIQGDATVPGTDGESGTITSELTLEYHCEKTGGLFTGITQADLS